jgi:adenosylcobinamide-GDP ribazoletransferase
MSLNWDAYNPSGESMSENEGTDRAALLRGLASRRSAVNGDQGLEAELATPGRADGGSEISPVQGWLRAPFVAMQFLTVVPPTVRRALRPEDLGRSEAFFPLVGLALGTVLMLVDWACASILAQPVRDVLLVGLLATMTGALHLDGVIDTFDGLFAGRTPERRLEIMRDPRAGSYGVVAVILLLALKIAALVSLPLAIRPYALVLAPCLGRWAIVLSTGAFAYARPDGMGRDFKEAIRLRHVVVAGLTALLAAAILAGPQGVLTWTAGSLAVLVAGQWISARLGGLSGDIYGAVCESIETATLVLLGIHIGSLFG